MQRRAAIIAYDIGCNRRRRRVHRCLERWRLAGQRSLCECRLNRREAEELFLQLMEHIDQDTDRLVLAWVDKPEDAQVLVGGGYIGFRQPGLYLG